MIEIGGHLDEVTAALTIFIEIGGSPARFFDHPTHAVTVVSRTVPILSNIGRESLSNPCFHRRLMIVSYLS